MCGLFKELSVEPMTMIRSSSPAMSEISVGSPSPPPSQRTFFLAAAVKPTLQNSFSSLKRLKGQLESPQHREFLPPVPQRRKSSNERVKSFSIADILGRNDDKNESRQSEITPSSATLKACPPLPTLPGSIPLTHPLPLAAAVSPSAAPLIMLDLPTIHKVLPPAWSDHARLAATAVTNVANSPHLPVHPFFPPGLLHYEQRLAWDYQRQLQEHFHAQAQLLRQMSMDPNIIPSEDGSERGGSRDSSSGGSQCCSPEVNVASDDDDDVEEDDEKDMESKINRRQSESLERLSNHETEGNVKRKTDKPTKNTGDTPLDALFQLSTKNFDEDQGKSESSYIQILHSVLGIVIKLKFVLQITSIFIESFYLICSEQLCYVGSLKTDV